jgi:hypothetical protein
MGLKTVRSTVLTAEEAMIVVFRKQTLLPLHDCLYALQTTIPHLTRVILAPLPAAPWDQPAACNCQ